MTVEEQMDAAKSDMMGFVSKYAIGRVKGFNATCLFVALAAALRDLLQQAGMSPPEAESKAVGCLVEALAIVTHVPDSKPN